MANPQRKRLGEVLVEAGVIDPTQLQAALGHQRRWGGRIGQALVDLKMATEEQIVATLATKLGFPRVELDGIEYGPGLELALRLVPHEFAERNQLLPYAADPTYLWVAMADPTNFGVIDELAFRTGRHVKISIAGDREIARTVRRLYLGDKRGIEAIALDERDLGPVEVVGPLEAGAGSGLDDYFTRGDFTPGAKVAAPATTASTPTPPPPGAPPPLPVKPGAPPPAVLGSGPEMRLAAAVRGLRMSGGEPEVEPEPMLTPPPTPAFTPPRPVPSAPPGLSPALTPLPGAPPELIIEVQPDGEPEYGPRVEAMLDSLERIGTREPAAPDTARLARLSSALLRLLLRKGVVSEAELADAFVKAERGPLRR